jgi:hypothetical protein
LHTAALLLQNCCSNWYCSAAAKREQQGEVREEERERREERGERREERGERREERGERS